MQLFTRAEINRLGDKTQRWHFVARNLLDGEPLFARTATIPQRSLTTVGGTREGRTYTRRADRKARDAGFPNAHAQTKFMARMLMLRGAGAK